MAVGTQTKQQQWSSVSSRYQRMSPSEFTTEFENTWEALSAIRETIVEQVNKNNLRPIDAVKSVACLTGSAFGYEEFHPRSGSSHEQLQNLMQALQYGGKQQQPSSVS